MIITADSITLSFLVVASVTLAVVIVLVWYVYTTKKFREDIIKLMDDKLQMYLDNLEGPKQEEEKQEVPDELPKLQEDKKDETEFAEKREEPQQERTPNFVTDKDFVENTDNWKQRTEIKNE